MSYELVWFKRDLRLHDHAALTCAANKGLVRCIYIIEPDLWKLPDMALQHFAFIKESLIELHEALQQCGGAIEIHTGSAVDVLKAIFQEAPFNTLHSHEETGNAFTYQRDLEVMNWCKEQHISWSEYPQFGVVRPLKNRNLWQGAWETHMAQQQFSHPTINFWRNYPKTYIHIPTPKFLSHDPPQRQRGGRSLALKTLHYFLSEGSTNYRGGISSPLLAPTACSRLSPYLSYGCLSMREVVQQTRAAIQQLPTGSTRHKAGLEAFLSRLYWHCHFIQKLESEPAIEWQNMHRGYDGLRESEFSEEYFEALKNARTGWPMVDACVMMLKETGWLNFRMRAMLVSVAAYPLWLHWRPVGEWLATHFLDYEPGIHWSQLQMQSGTTGINATRVYNPIKQAQDHDPRGYFVRKWLPYMRTVSDNWLLEPWKMPRSMQAMEIPQPIIDLTLATKVAKQRFYERRNQDLVRSAKEPIIQRHASRSHLNSQITLRSSSRKPAKAKATQLQMDLFAPE